MELTIYASMAFFCVYVVALTVRRVRFTRDRRRMERETRAGGRVIASVQEMVPGTVKKFWLICDKYRVSCFLINYQGGFHAYVNSCRHLITPLDFVRYQFFTEDGRHLVCLTHGALYEPDTGMCVAGPCEGLYLHALPVSVESDEIVVGCPTGDRSFLSELSD